MIRRLLVVAAVLLALLAGALGVLIFLPAAPAGEQFVVIVPRSSSAAIARQLAERGIVRHRYLFLAARALRSRARLQAGEYRFAGPASPARVLDRLVRGDIYYHEITIPEGFNLFDIGDLLGRTGLIGEQDWLQAARDPALSAELVPEAGSLEGYLFPDTYRVTRGTTARELCRQMVRRFRAMQQELGLPAGAELHRLVALASLVEKETAVSGERPLVASVFVNRLAGGMRLECDPTVIYAALLEGAWRGTIYRSDLDRPHPYNTYRTAGLPPGPIANPGRAALAAALRPARTDYLFFVAAPGDTGKHIFSQTLADHNAAVARYRRGATAQ